MSLGYLHIHIYILRVLDVHNSVPTYSRYKLNDISKHLNTGKRLRKREFFWNPLRFMTFAVREFYKSDCGIRILT